MDIRTTAVAFKALGDENRLHILKLLCTGEKCACKLLEALQISQPTLSHHMKILCDAGLVAARKEGKWTHYSIHHAGIRTLRSAFEEIILPEGQTNPCSCKEA